MFLSVQPKSTIDKQPENIDEDNNNVNEIINIECKLPSNIFVCSYLNNHIREYKIKKGCCYETNTPFAQ